MRRTIKRVVMWLFLRHWISHQTVERVFARIDLRGA
jgi:hypothetical protein